MRTLTLLVGNVLFFAGVAGLLASSAGAGVLTLSTPGGPAAVVQELKRRAVPLPAAAPEAAGVASPPVELAQPGAQPGAQPAHGPRPDPEHSATAVRIPRIGLAAEAVLARLIQVNGGTTWEVPANKAGHGEYTGGAGQPGNAVLMGHVSSINAGNVFKDLDRARVGDIVEVDSAAGTFTYRVAEIRVVSRTDLSVIKPTEEPTLSLITCTGAWLPQINEFSERLVVRAVLVS